MITVLAGLPGRFTDFCRDLCVAAISAPGKRCTVLEIGSLLGQSDLLSLLGESVLRSDSDHTLVVARSLDRSAAQLLVGIERPILVAYESPIHVAEYMVSQGMDAGVTTRAVAMSCACLEQVVSSANSKNLSPEQAAADPEAFLATIESVTGAKTGVSLDAVIGSLPGHQPSAAQNADNLTLRAALQGYDSARLARRAVQTVIATRSLFFLAEPHGAVVPARVDITGRARCIAYGPYISLPVGTWSVRFHCAFSGELSDSSFTLDAVSNRNGAQRELAKTNFKAFPGKYVAQLYIESIDPDAHIEFRFFVDNAVFDGQLALGYVEMTRVQMTEGRDIEDLLASGASGA